MHYFKRQWHSLRGDAHDDWGASIWYFETDPDLSGTRQIEVYANGTVLHYDHGHVENACGRLAEKPLAEEEWAEFAIAEREFTQIWSLRKPFNR